MSYITSIIKGSKEEPICAKGSEEEPICATSQADFLFDFFNINPLDYDEDIYVALNKTVEELGLTDYCVFFAGTSDSRKEYNNLKSIDNDYNILISYNTLIPDFSPEGTSVISFTKLFSESGDWAKLKPEEYYKIKDKMIAKCIDDVKKNLGIDITPYIEEVEVVEFL